ncbi:ester cyclase [Bacillus horti]|uniref:Ester cyclase n=1 Tax=Caldalkalibacillus horti TaxID=77523 RepID=A0ABT9VYY7_9BACI|nr:ester cyclase [Bacillus horti]MDQ0166184.1 putative ester cyclase [Bacillus horti]
MKELTEIYPLWVKAWNEDINVLDEITSPDCIVHQTRTDGKSSTELTGKDALKGIIQDGCAFFDDVVMSIEVGPIVADPYVSARWRFTGKYKGGMNGAQADIGEEVSFHGMDIFLVNDGKIKEYWVSSDGIHLLVQLKMF